MNRIFCRRRHRLLMLSLLMVVCIAGCGDRGGGYVVMRGGVAENHPPVARAGTYQPIVAGVAVVLDGSQSYDPNGDAVTYAWSLDAKPAGSKAVLSDSTTVHPSFVPDRSGSYTVSLVVSDAVLASEAATVVLTVTNSSPVANAGPDQDVSVGALVTLDGSSSSDVNGDPLTYSWTMYPPLKSTAVLFDSKSANPTFTPDVPGTYSFSLYVYDGNAGMSDFMEVNAGLTAVAKAGPDQYHPTGPSTVVTLDGSGSYDVMGNPVAYAWSFTRKPAGSSAELSDPSAAQPTFTVDKEGIYEVSLVMMNGSYVASAADSVKITVITDRPVAELAFKVLDAEYSNQLDRIIMVSSAPSNLIHIYDPLANSDQAVTLSGVPTSVSVGPDGLHAAVGHDGFISYVDLVSKAVTTVLPVSFNVADVVLAGNGYVYAFPSKGAFYGVNTSSGSATTGAGNFPWDGTRAKLHPSGSVLYADAYSYCMQKFDISSGTPVLLYTSAFPGFSRSAGGELWMLEDGTGFVTRSESINSASTGTTNDLLTPLVVNLGSTSYGGGIQHADDSAAIAELAVIPISGDVEVRIFNETPFALQNAIALPHCVTSGGDYLWHGKFVFFNSTGSKMFVVVQADTTAGLSNDFGLLTY